MTSRDPRTGRYVSTANTPESREGKFPTYTDMPVEIEGADPAELAFDSVPRRGPAADELAQGGESRLRPRHPALVSMDEDARTLYGVQGGRLRDAARVSGLDGLAGHVLGLYPPAATSSGVPGTRRMLPSIGRTDDAPASVDTGLDNPGGIFR